MENNLIVVILAAIAPAVVLLVHTYLRDKNQREPVSWMLKGVMYGVLSTLISMLFAAPASVVVSMQMGSSMLANTAKAFCLAAIPEESAKLICLYLLLRKNPYFDEKVDGIVYAACVGMGFAGLENVMYLVQNLQGGHWIGVGVARAIFAVPGHYFFAVAMGYFYSFAHFSETGKKRYYILALLVPIFLHGVYDGILFSLGISPAHGAILGVVFLFFCFFTAKKGSKRITAHLLADKNELFDNRTA